MAAKKFQVEEGLRVSVINGVYKGLPGEVLNKIGNQWRVRLDQAHKLALVDEDDIGEPVEDGAATRIADEQAEEKPVATPPKKTTK